MSTKYIGIAIFLFASMLASSSQMLLKHAALKPYIKLKRYFNVFVLAGYSLLFTSLILNTSAYRFITFGLGVALASISYVLVLILSRIFFNEKITLRKIIGIAFIISGILLYGLTPQ